ncbi:putative glucan 1,3-beta-glucosidase [Helianthus annuus]|nr:putative glucan 1,3-beta-glucosidase [Helianthus annuus]
MWRMDPSSGKGFQGIILLLAPTILSAIKTAVDPRTQVVYNENPDDKYMKSNKFDYAIVVVGEYPYAEFLGDSSNLTIPEPGPTPSTGSVVQ